MIKVMNNAEKNNLILIHFLVWDNDPLCLCNSRQHSNPKSVAFYGSTMPSGIGNRGDPLFMEFECHKYLRSPFHFI